MTRHLICYDVRDEKRLAKVRRVVYAHAYGGQKSALEAPLTPREAKAVLTEISQKMNASEDSLLIVPVGEEAILLGRARQLSLDENGVIIL